MDFFIYLFQSKERIMLLSEILKEKIEEKSNYVTYLNHLNQEREKIALKFDKEYLVLSKQVQNTPGHTSYAIRLAVRESTKMIKYRKEISENSEKRKEVFKKIKTLKTEIKILNETNSKLNNKCKYQEHQNH